MDVMEASRVLVVDDEPLIRWWLSESLGARGYEVVEAEDGHGAVGAMAESDAAFDLVLLDYRLPDSIDLALLSQLRRLGPDARFILMTAYGTPELEQQALDIGACAVVTKPFAIEDVETLNSDDRDG